MIRYGLIIPDPDLIFLPIPDPGVKKASDPQLWFLVVTWARLSQDRLTVTGGGRASEGGRDMVMDEGRGGGVAPWLEEEWRERSLT